MSILLHTQEVSEERLPECPDEGDVNIPLENCSEYYVCSNGQGVVQPCPDNLYWNPETQECDYPENVPECVDGTRPPIGPTDPTTSGPTVDPTDEPTEEPTTEPTEEPTTEPTEKPTTEPTEEPTTERTQEPTTEPTEEPTNGPKPECPAEGFHQIPHECKHNSLHKFNLPKLNSTKY